MIHLMDICMYITDAIYHRNESFFEANESQMYMVMTFDHKSISLSFDSFKLLNGFSIQTVETPTDVSIHRIKWIVSNLSVFAV